ncbi:MAG: glucose-6-phosphate isomerase [Geodermatophilaceae bacterium]|nr:glucose-6-phosphate isomerase [Geodermatophilaceae bacterium]
MTSGGLHVEVADDAAATAAEQARDTQIADDLPARLIARDATLWGPEAEDEAAIRLGWLDTFRRSRELLPRLAALHSELADEELDHVVLAGMGGSSLAPEVICQSAGVDLTVLDTTDPGQVRAALADRLQRTVVVVSSKSGGTVETDSHRRAYLQAFVDSGLSEADAGRRFVIVTDPGSPFVETAEQMGAREIFLADPDVGGRYSALTAFGLVPSALAGADVENLLDDAETLAGQLGADNPALLLGCLLGSQATAGRDKLLLADNDSGITGLGDWAEQLIAESTGKHARGILPVVVQSARAFDGVGPDALTVLSGRPAGGGEAAAVAGPLGAQFLGWEYATAVAGRIIGINPFDQPNVTESKNNTKKLLDAGLPEVSPAATFGAVEVYADPALLGSAGSLSDVLDAVVAAIPEHGYLAIMAYLDRWADASAADLRDLLARGTQRPVTFGWGPRFLHSTGQFHKGGPPVGAFLQITGAIAEDLAIPGQDYTFAGLQAAQAAGDLQALTGRELPAFRLHLTDRAAGLGQLLGAGE